MFRLSDLLKYNSIVIQCHDHPDADTIASAFAVYSFLRLRGKDAKIIYSGFERIKKCNLQMLLERLEIPITHVLELEKPGLILCVDCQYGEGNVTKLEAEAVAIIDHHLQVNYNFDCGIIQSYLGSCSTLIWELLCREGFNFSENRNIATALYYGLFSDTNSFSEINHPLDKDMRDNLSKYCDMALIDRLRHSNLTLEELEIAGVALLRNINDDNRRYALFKAESCDPNILGFISDLGLQVNTIDLCVVYSQHENGAKVSVRSCSHEVMASEFVDYLTSGVGSGGGHREKAGGFIQKAGIDEMGITITEYINRRTDEYFKSFDIIAASDHNIDVSKMKRFRPKPVPKGFVPSTDIFEENTPVTIRTLENDSNIKASPDIFLMVGIKGEVYPVKASKFRSGYTVCNVPLKTDYLYVPTVKNEITGEVKELLPYIKSCISTGETPAYASVLTRNVKIFNSWNPNGYMYGRPGDYLAVKCNDLNDVYIIKEDIFLQTYEECAD